MLVTSIHIMANKKNTRECLFNFYSSLVYKPNPPTSVLMGILPQQQLHAFVISKQLKLSQYLLANEQRA
ncbi:unnamed protein product [Ectocarpus sp. 6 AP-2014]